MAKRTKRSAKAKRMEGSRPSAKTVVEADPEVVALDPVIKPLEEEDLAAVASAKEGQPKAHWPGDCPLCGSKLEVYSTITDHQRNRRTRYYRCIDSARCYHRTSTVEKLKERQELHHEGHEVREE